ncbi:RNA polymerase III subunit RPC82 helix-turn-helix domain-containing protein [Batrachochytrium dendrobatidis JEL423]|uniref:DNA-directed RNA polymerase III subunit RPC3 n=1 Tax=Batrachochytrium dendrobatidis (strain JEL423) TaxID=403673 RepID=A0A177WWZ5_BATDL|nr:RNA polymerase III subunit RPC82 helix-turn-helix domain-containing protein [Batrachochytrium dendrobatidis JEL423]
MSKIELGLCGEILKEHFGSLVQSQSTTVELWLRIDFLIIDKVGFVLLSKGRSNLAAIAQSSKLPIKIIRESLFILIQNHQVTFAENTEGMRVVVYYEANIKEILLRDRFALYISTASTHLGVNAGLIISKVLEAGYLAPLKLLKSCKLTEKDISACMEKLVQGRFVRTVSAIDSLTINDKYILEEREAIANTGAGAPLSSTELAKLRKSLAEKRSNYAQTPSSGTKRKVLDFEEEENRKKLRGDLYSIVHDTNYYAVDFERFHILLRNDAKLASQRVNDTAGRLIKAMLDHTYSQLNSCKEPLSPSIRREMIGTLVRGQELHVHGHSNDPAMEYIEALVSERAKIVSNLNGTLYAINLRDSVRVMQIDLIESIIQEKFGDVCRRIWRLLYMKQKLDEKQVGKQAMINNKVARECLYTMLKEGLVYLQVSHGF